MCVCWSLTAGQTEGTSLKHMDQLVLNLVLMTVWTQLTDDDDDDVIVDEDVFYLMV